MQHRNAFFALLWCGGMKFCKWDLWSWHYAMWKCSRPNCGGPRTFTYSSSHPHHQQSRGGSNTSSFGNPKIQLTPTISSYCCHRHRCQTTHCNTHILASGIWNSSTSIPAWQHLKRHSFKNSAQLHSVEDSGAIVPCRPNTKYYSQDKQLYLQWPFGCVDKMWRELRRRRS